MSKQEISEDVRMRVLAQATKGRWPADISKETGITIAQVWEIVEDAKRNIPELRELLSDWKRISR